MRARLTSSKNLFFLYFIVLFTSCVDLDKNESLSSIKIDNMQIKAINNEIKMLSDEEQTEEVKARVKKLTEESENLQQETNKDIKSTCGTILTTEQCDNFRKAIVKPTGGCSVSSCIKLPDYILLTRPYQSINYKFYYSGEEEEVFSKEVNKDSEESNYKGIYAEKVNNLEAGKIYDIIIEKKDYSNNITTHTYKNVTLVSD